MHIVNLVAPCDITDMVGLIPYFLDENDPRPACDQFDANYQHGGGWRSMDGFKLNHKTFTLTYPGDPPYKPLAMIALRKEKIFIYEYAFVCVLQPEGLFSVARLD